MPENIGKWTVGLVVGVCLVMLLGWATRVICLGGFFGMPPCRTINAYKIYNNGADEVAGPFIIRKSAFDAIQSYGIAGSCITADYAAFNLPKIKGKGEQCSTDADCHGPILAIPPYNGWESLCHKEEGTCWVRPGKGGPDVCNKDQTTPRNDGWQYFSFGKPPAGPYKLATLNGKLDGMPILKPERVGKPINMRLIACLNGVDTNGPPTPCADDPSNRIFKFSDVSTMNLPPPQ